MKLDELDDQQKAAIFTKSKNALVLAGAGSGKTRVLTARIRHLIEDGKASPSDIVAVTFTRKAAQKMKDRLGKLSNNLHIGTFHSIALDHIKKYGEALGVDTKRLTIYSQVETEILIEEAAKLSGALKIVSGKKVWKVAKKNIEDHEPTQKIIAGMLLENHALTYDLILEKFFELLPHIENSLFYRHILIDEVQDMDELQWKIIEQLREMLKCSIFAVGDIDQCQPAGTMVLLSDNTEIGIENLDPSIHELRVYDKHDAIICGGHNKGFKFLKSQSYYSGLLCEIKTSDKKTYCTENHKWYVKWADRNIEKNVVYLMKKKDRFRVGWCQLFAKRNGNLHLGIRARLEKADEVWILKIFNTKREASIYEQIISVKYGIPTVMFTPNNNSYYDENGINEIFMEIGDIESKAIDCLNKHGRSIYHPFWDREKIFSKQGATTVFEISTFNFINDLFMVPVRHNHRFIKWEKASISNKLVENMMVYSLDVEKHHTYIADGICTKNSIYGFRGALPEYLVKNQDEFDIFRIEKNYRSRKEIVNAANNLISHNTDRIKKTMMPTIEELNTGCVFIEGEMDTNNIIKNFWQMTNPEDEGKVAILSRNHFLLEKLSRKMDEEGIDYHYIGKKQKLTATIEFILIHAFLKLLVNPFDNFSFLLIKDYLMDRNEYLPLCFDAIKNKKSHFQQWNHGVNFKRFENMVQTRTKLIFLFLQKIKTIQNFIDILKDIDFGFDFEHVLNFICDYIRDYPLSSIQSYLNWLSCFDHQDDVENDSKIILSTVHGAKGLEWDNVIIVGLNEDIFPSKRSLAEGNEEEERRIMYVAMTRAKEVLHLTSRPVVKIINDKTQNNPVSRFIGESVGFIT